MIDVEDIDMKTRWSVSSWMLVMAALSSASIAGARPRHPALGEKVHEAAIIATGDVAYVGDTVGVKVTEVLKGPSSSVPELDLAWAKFSSVESRLPELKIGDHVLVFANSIDGKYEPVGGTDGVVKSDENKKQAVRWLLNYEDAKDAASRQQALGKMLDSNSDAAQDAALKLIYLEGHHQKFDPKAFSTQVLALTKSKNIKIAVAATQTLGRVGDKPEIPALIELLGSPDKNVAETAHQALVTRTGGKIPFDSNASSDERGKAAQQWKDWWEKNQEKAKLRH
jgi:hypothetical protein